MVYQRVRYRLIDNDRQKELWLENDPKGWNESEKTLKRSDKTYGVFTELSKGLEFFEEGADFLRLAKINRDIEANVVLEEWRMHPQEDTEYRHSKGTLDFSEYEETILGIKVPFKTGGLNAIIKSKRAEKFELDRLLSVKNENIDALLKKNVEFKGRDIYLITTWDTEGSNQEIGDLGSTISRVNANNNTGRTSGDINSLPIKIIGQSHEPWATSVTPVRNDGDGEGGITYTLSAGNMFFLKTDQRRELKIDFKYDFIARFQQYEDIDWCFYRLSLSKFYTNEQGLLQFKDRKVIHEIKTADAPTFPDTILSEVKMVGNFNGAKPQFTHPMKGEYIATEVIEPGESLCFELWVRADLRNTNNAGVRVDAQQVNTTLKIEEESYFDPTVGKTALMHDVGDKLMQIITGEKLKFKSNFYGRKDDLGYEEDGYYAFTGLTSGFWVRGFLDKEMELSLKDFLETSNAIHNTGYSIEEKDDEEYLILEDMNYFFQNEVTIVLPEQVSNLTRKTASELYYSTLEFGYKKPEGDNLYEESLGLDEYNTKTSYSTPITRVDNKYVKLSPARADSYGMEFARRKQKVTFPEEDTRYDKTVFLLDLKESQTDVLEQRKWADDFETAPIGVYSPETATNLRLTPGRVSKRHEWFYGSGLKKFQQESITHSNSVGNSYLETKKVDEDILKERGDVLISSLERSKFANEWIEFDYEVDFFVNQQVYGYTEINGKSVPNYFGRVKFINEKGLTEYGYLFELKPNKEGKWKLLKAI